MRPSGSVRAPEIALPGLAWLNTPAPLPLARLRGRLVLLEFWTAGCIACAHGVPGLRRVAQGFPDTVVVVGVHTPKFAAERDPRALAAAVARLGIAWPVVHDPDRRLWDAFAIKAWPTLVVLSPDSYVIAQHQGESDPDELFEHVGDAVAAYARHGRVWPADLPPAAAAEPARRFRFPAAIKPVPDGGYALADSGHNQIVMLEDDGSERVRIGSGVSGLDDGPHDRASFNAPQGLAADDDAVYVADTGNHAIRRIDGETGAVVTLAGDGRRGGLLPAAAARIALASPWDLACAGRRLLFANAGTNQLGTLDLADGRAAALAGGGMEGMRDGPAADALLAQPSGLALDDGGRVLFFVDAESSAVRRLDLAAGTIATLAGGGLFGFGHRNGRAAEARFQHPLALAWERHRDGPRLLVADSYNARLRALALETLVVSDLDAEIACADAVCLPLDRPAGVTATPEGRILVADANNHRILVYDMGQRSYRTWAG